MKLLEKWLHFYRTYTLGYSIRRINPDELEIRHLILDAFPRGMIRLIFLAILGVIAFIDLQHGVTPFDNQIKAIKYDFEWAYIPDKFIQPLYEGHIERRNNPTFMRKYPNERILPYEEYRKPYLERDSLRLIRPIFHIYLAFIPPLYSFPATSSWDSDQPQEKSDLSTTSRQRILAGIHTGRGGSVKRYCV